MTGAGDAAVVSVLVAVPPPLAFDLFTRDIDRWWRHGPRFRIAGRQSGRLAFEPRLGGRLSEVVELATGSCSFDVGSITRWDPPHGLQFEWRGVNFAPGEVTTVDVGFVADGDGTRVTLRHHGWSGLRDDHPARHGATGAAFSRRLGLWWGDLMSALREYAAVAGRPSP